MTDHEIKTALSSIEAGKADVINNRAVLNDNGYFIVEGFKNKRLHWMDAVAKLRKPKRANRLA